MPIKTVDCIPEELTAIDKKHGVVLARHLGGRCKQLEGVIGECVGCRIYETRPSVCREFAPGSDGCLRAREVMRRKMEPERMEWKPRGYGTDWQDTV